MGTRTRRRSEQGDKQKHGWEKGQEGSRNRDRKRIVDRNKDKTEGGAWIGTEAWIGIRTREPEQE